MLMGRISYIYDICWESIVIHITRGAGSDILYLCEICALSHTCKSELCGECDMDASLREEVNSLHAQICGALADPNRILILYALADQPHRVGDLASTLGLAQPTASRHLKVLRERGLVTAQRNGQAVVYALADARVTQALNLLRAVLADLLQNQSELGRTVNEQLMS